MSRPVRVLIVDDHAFMRQGLRTLLTLDNRVEVVGEASDGVDALEQVAVLKPDVALVDVRMPRMDGVELVQRLSAEHPEVVAIILTTFDDDEYVFEGLRAGARGYFLKDTPADELVLAIEKVHRGEAALGGHIASKVISEVRRLSDTERQPVHSDLLSERELEVLRLVAAGDSNREIAERLFVTEGTVKNHISHILQKLDLRYRTQAALYAAEHGWIEPA